MAHEFEEESVKNKNNLARFFIEQRHVAWVSLAFAVVWGIYGLQQMPQRKDPDIPVRQAMIIVPWQGTSAGTSRAIGKQENRTSHCPESMGNGNQEHFPDRLGDGSV